MKYLSSSIFIIIVFISVKLYLNRDTKTLRQTFEDAKTAQPSVIIDSFVYHRYQAGKVETRVEAKVGQFIEPNRAEFFGDFRLDSYKNNERTTLQSNQAAGIFNSKGLATMMTGAKLDTITFENFVRIKYKDNFLTTDYAQYIAKNNKIVSSSNAKVTNDTHWFTAEKGFVLDLKNEAADFNGKIIGEVIPPKETNEKQSN